MVAASSPVEQGSPQTNLSHPRDRAKPERHAISDRREPSPDVSFGDRA